MACSMQQRTKKLSQSCLKTLQQQQCNLYSSRQRNLNTCIYGGVSFWNKNSNSNNSTNNKWISNNRWNKRHFSTEFESKTKSKFKSDDLTEKKQTTQSVNLTKAKDIKKDSLNIGFVGGGNMGTALCCSILSSNILLPKSKITITDKNQSCLDTANTKVAALLTRENSNINSKELSFSTTIENSAVIGCDIVFLCIKPQNTKTVLSKLREHWKGNELIISIMAGVTTEEIGAYFKPSLHQRIIRVMPNTPAMVGSMAAGVFKGMYATDADMTLVNNLMSTLGVCKTIEKEYLMDSVTGLSGSGPAYVYVFIEALADAGVKCGLTRSDALTLATQTVYGSAKMVKETGLHPAILKDQVTSPGGTSIAGVTALEHENFRHSVINAVQQATDRARKLGSD